MAGEPQARLTIVGRPQDVALSTSTALMRWPIVYDVNGYYAALGVLPSATRRELMAAYRARDGEDDPYLTYVFKQLLNPRTRAQYDAVEPGKILVDRYVLQAISRNFNKKISAQNAANGTSTTLAEILESLLDALGKRASDSFDPASPGGLQCEASGPRQGPAAPGEARSYAFLLLGSTCDDTRRLTQWQEGVGHALADRGCHRYAVGFHGLPGRKFLVVKIAGVPAVLLHENEPVTGALITAAATAAAQPP